MKSSNTIKLAILSTAHLLVAANLVAEDPVASNQTENVTVDVSKNIMCQKMLRNARVSNAWQNSVHLAAEGLRLGKCVAYWSIW